MKNIKATLGIVMIFVLGAVSGSIVTHMVHRARMESFIRGGPGPREEMIVSRLTRELRLDDAQQQQVREIIKNQHAAMREVRRQSSPRIRALVDEGQSKIMALLNPEQQEKFRKIMEERRRHHPPPP